jgi:hypothetical protein
MVPYCSTLKRSARDYQRQTPIEGAVAQAYYTTAELVPQMIIRITRTNVTSCKLALASRNYGLLITQEDKSLLQLQPLLQHSRLMHGYH